jgi:hypothetical protein
LRNVPSRSSAKACRSSACEGGLAGPGRPDEDRRPQTAHVAEQRLPTLPRDRARHLHIHAGRDRLDRCPRGAGIRGKVRLGEHDNRRGAGAPREGELATGGLKAIEGTLGLGRDGAIRDLSGYDAVILWRKHLRGDRRALELLVEYNRADVVHLKTMLEICYDRLASYATLAIPAKPRGRPS